MLLLSKAAISQADSVSIKLHDKILESFNRDSSNTLPDSLRLIKPLPPKRGGIDTIVDYHASDTIAFDAKQKTMRLSGDAEIKYKSQQLNSNIITINFDSNTMDAVAEKDSAGIYRGFPKFKDGEEEFVGEHIKYNFKTNKGTVSLGETQVKDGFYFGEKIKRVSPTELYVKNGRYTTCDDPNPHYYFGSPEMKVIPDHAVYMDPLIFYIEDIPVFILPTGLFFTFQKGRSSGILIPEFFFSASRGVVFQNFGYYWAASDYWDTKLTADFYSKGGYLLKNFTQWKLTNEFSGSMNLQYGNVRSDVNQPWTETWQLGLNHHQDFTPSDKLDLNLNFSSQNFNRLTSTDLQQIVQQNATSNASYSHYFDNRSNLSLLFSRDQNIITNEYNQNIPLSYNFPSIKIMNSFTGLPQWMREITFSYGFRAQYSDSYKRNITSTMQEDSTYLYDTTYTNSYKANISHNPTLSISPKFGHFTITPSISFAAQNYFRKIHKTYNAQDSSVIVDTTQGFFTEYRGSFGVSAATKLYGMIDDSKPLLGFIKPSMIGIKAVRHVYSPSLSFSVTPDQSGASDGFYGTYYDSARQQDVQYSYYELDGGGIASRAFSGLLNYSDQNSLDIKLPSKDTLPERNITLLNWNTSLGYDFAKDSLNFSRLNIGFNTPDLGFLKFFGSAGFTLYDEVPVYTDSVNYTYKQINKFLFQDGKSLARLTNLELSFTTNFSSKGIQINTSATQKPDTTAEQQDSVSLGSRFLNRQNAREKELDLWGDSTPGYSPISIPWVFGAGLTYRYSAQTADPRFKTETINLTFNLQFTLANEWKINTSAQYDLFNGNLQIPAINISRQLHCWDMSLVWYPVGFNQGFQFRIAIRNPMLKDLKYEKQNNRLLR